MAIRVKHGRPETLITAAQMAGQARKQEKIQKMQMDFDYRQSLRQQDMVIDLQMQERAKMWEIEKMQLRSQMDFQREEQQRQRKLDSADNALQQIDKEVLAGRMTEQEAYPLKLKYEMNKLGVDTPTSLLPTGDEEEERYGVRPYYLDPAYVEANPAAARQAQEARGIFLSDEEFNTLQRGVSEIPLGDKQLDIGIQAEGIISGLPTITSDAEYDALPSGTEFIDQDGRRWRKP